MRSFAPSFLGDGWALFFVTIHLICDTIPTAHAFLIHSEGSGGWATGMTLNNDEVIVVGTTFAKTFWGTSREEAMGCFLAAGNPYESETSSFTRSRLESPHICVGGSSVVNQDMAAIAGISFWNDPHAANSNGLHTIRFQENRPISDGSHSLPTATAPVAMTLHETFDGQVYIGLHDSSNHALDITKMNANVDSTTALSELLDYWSALTNPDEEMIVDIPDVPEIIQVDTNTGNVQSLMTLIPGDVDASSTHITALHMTSKVLIVAGNTNTQVSGSNFIEDPATEWDQPVVGDWDGFVSFMNPTTGALDESLVRNSFRIASPHHQLDHVQDICVLDTDLFVVGTTEGQLAGESSSTDVGGTFVLKIGLNNQAIYWQSQIAMEGVNGNRCTVGTDAVYVAGSTSAHLKSGANYGKSLSTQDAFVTKFDRSTGDILWTTELDTSILHKDERDDHVVSIAVNPKGNLNLLLNSMNLAKGVNDVVLLDVDAITGATDLDNLMENGKSLPTVALICIITAPFVLFGLSCIVGRQRNKKLQRQCTIPEDGLFRDNPSDSRVDPTQENLASASQVQSELL